MSPIRRFTIAGFLCVPVWLHAEPSVQVGFSPEGSARKLVMEVIEGAQNSIQMQAYSFRSPDIAQALVRAQSRGVEVRIVVDKKRNQNKTSKSVMDFVSSQGVQVRTNHHFNLHHDKVIIVDGHTVETGSFNFAPSAEKANSENVVVMRGMPDVANQYLKHWQSRWDLGQAYAVSVQEAR
ncbi:phospholipase D family protein [Ottowia thiooxydans]|uniref:phospholipase D n=1 Tax=Ottowia thiooxydans TaxID=219182 RepID=A0ABV2Q9J4_9BURK